MKHAVDWATSKGLVQVNPVHGEKEYRIPHTRSFDHKETDMSRSTASVNLQLQARNGDVDSCRLGWS